MLAYRENFIFCSVAKVALERLILRNLAGDNLLSRGIFMRIGATDTRNPSNVSYFLGLHNE